MRRFLVTVLILAGCTSLLFGQQPKMFAPHKPIPDRVPESLVHREPGIPRSMVGGFWMVDANRKASIYMRNALETSSITVTPNLYLSNGAKFKLKAVTLPPLGTSVLSINEALDQQGISSSATLSGYVEVEYTWAWDPLCVTVTSTDTIHSVIFNSGFQPSVVADLQVRMLKGEVEGMHAVEGMWWKPEPGVTAFVALSNTTAEPVTARVQFNDSANKALREHMVRVSPHGSKIVVLDALSEAAAGSAGGLRVLHTGSVEGLLINGVMEDQATGYSANLPFHYDFNLSPKQTGPETYAQLGLMTGAADPMMQFPAGTMFTPFSVARNVSDQPASVTPTFYWMLGGTAHSATLQPITLAPMETRALDISELLMSARLASFNGSINLILEAHGALHSLLLAGGSVDRKNTYVFQVFPRTVQESTGKSISYWSTGNGDDTMVTIWNPADEAQDYKFTLFFEGGHYQLPVRLEARATQAFNISEIIQNQIPDQEGNLIPPAVHEGSAEITGAQAHNQTILVAVDAGTYNVRKATCSYYCISCDGEVLTYLVVSPFGVAKGGTSRLTFTIQDNHGNQYQAAGTWSSSNTGVATVTRQDWGEYGQVAGKTLGSATFYADGFGAIYNSYYCAYDPSCPDNNNFQGSGGGTVNPPPHITGVSPGSGQVGSVVPVLIYGSNFASSAAALSIGGIPGSVSGVSGSGNSQTISASFDLTSQSPGTYSFTVNLANNDGGSVQSDNSWPFSAMPVITGINLVSGTAGFVPVRSSSVSDGDNFVTYTASCNPANGNFSWTTSSSNVTLENASGPTVVINGAKPSASLNDTVVQVTCSLNGETSTASSVKLTVQQPTKLVKTGNDTTSAEAKCKTGGGSNGCGVNPGRQFTYQVYDQLTPANPIKGSLDFFDYIQTVQGSNGCNLTSYTTTCPGNNNQSCGKLTASGGTFPEALSICAPACLSGTSCIAQCKNGPTKANQTWTVNGFPLSGDVKALAYNCSSVLVNGQ